MPRREVVADACFLINVLAAGRAEELLAAADLALLTTTGAAREVRCCWAGDPAGPEQTPVSLEPLIRAGLVRAVPLPASAVDAFVQAAALLTDNDASVVALAAAADLTLASDDRRVRNVARALFPGIALLSTLDFIQAAAAAAGLSGASLRDSARNLRQRGRFLSPKGDPYGPWFMGLL